MKRISTFFLALAFQSLTFTAVDTKTHKTVTIKSFTNAWIVYIHDNEIVSHTASIFCNENSSDFSNPVYFIKVQAKSYSDYDFKGLYQLHEGKTKLVLENGQAADASNDERQLVFIGASNGIYVYDALNGKTEKYGTLTDNILNIEKEVNTDTLYILTDEHLIYKVTEGGNNKTKIEEIQHAYEFILDNSNNLYFWSDDKLPFLYSEEGVKKIKGLPPNFIYANHANVPLFIKEDISNTERYDVRPSGNKVTKMKLEIKPLTFESYLIHYYSFEKKIYIYHKMLPSDIIKDMKVLYSENKDILQCIYSKLLHK